MVDWLNSAYDEATLKEASRSFSLSGNLQLLSFLSQKGLDQFRKLKFERAYEPTKHSYAVAKPPAFTESGEFLKILQSIVGKSKISSLACFRFSKGDYTVLYDALMPGRGVAFFLDIDDCDESWGGYTSFMKKEEVFRVVPKRNSLA